MPGLRIGIDVGGTFTHGVLLRPPAEVLATARTPTTHTAPRGVAEGVAMVLRLILQQMDTLGIPRSEIELVAHSTTQATNALLEGDVSGVHLAVVAPKSEAWLAKRALGERLLDVGNGHSLRIWPKLLLPWETATAEEYPAVLPERGSSDPHSAGTGDKGRSGPEGPRSGKTQSLSSAPLPANWRRPGWEGIGVPEGFTVSASLPVAVVQPLAGRQELREEAVAAHYRACGHSVVCAGEITQVLGLKARARTAIVNAAMLPRMLATADYTEQAVAGELPGVPLQVVRGDGGAMSLSELRRQPVQSLLSGPAAGASAALSLSGLPEVVFIEVGGTSTDITLIKGGRVRHRYATVGGQRLMVPALDLRTVAVGGGSMLRADRALYGPRSAHIAGLPYLFQALSAGLNVAAAERWHEADGSPPYVVARMGDGSLAAFTITDFWLCAMTPQSALEQFSIEISTEQIEALKAAAHLLGELVNYKVPQKSRKSAARYQEASLKAQGQQITPQIRRLLLDRQHQTQGSARVVHAYTATCGLVADAVFELTLAHASDLVADYALIAGGGGAPAIHLAVATIIGILPQVRLIPHHSVISAIGAALAVTCVSLSRTVAAPSGPDIASLTEEVEARLLAQGSERVDTDYEYDPQRQVLTVTGRGSRTWEQGLGVQTEAELAASAAALLNAEPDCVWRSAQLSLWTSPLPVRGSRQRIRAMAQDNHGRVVWRGTLRHWIAAEAGGIEATLADLLSRYTEYNDGGASLPGLALLAAGRLIPLDQLGSPELIAEVLRWEKLPAGSGGCFIIGNRH